MYIYRPEGFCSCLFLDVLHPRTVLYPRMQWMSAYHITQWLCSTFVCTEFFRLLLGLVMVEALETIGTSAVPDTGMYETRFPVSCPKYFVCSPAVLVGHVRGSRIVTQSMVNHLFLFVSHIPAALWSFSRAIALVLSIADNCQLLLGVPGWCCLFVFKWIWSIFRVFIIKRCISSDAITIKTLEKLNFSYITSYSHLKPVTLFTQLPSLFTQFIQCLTACLYCHWMEFLCWQSTNKWENRSCVETAFEQPLPLRTLYSRLHERLPLIISHLLEENEPTMNQKLLKNWTSPCEKRLSVSWIVVSIVAVVPIVAVVICFHFL